LGNVDQPLQTARVPTVDLGRVGPSGPFSLLVLDCKDSISVWSLFGQGLLT
jgi:hypothetical protein